MKLQRYNVSKSKGTNSPTVAHQQQDAFCKAKGGRLPTREELCPNYDAGKASAPALGCDDSASWVPYAGDTDQWMYIALLADPPPPRTHAHTHTHTHTHTPRPLGSSGATGHARTT